jgi:hypothetical protein
VCGAKPGSSRSLLRASPRRKRPLARTPRVRQCHGVAAALVSAHARRGRSGGKLNTAPPNAARPSAQRPPPRPSVLRFPHRSARRYDSLQRQRQHHDGQGSPWPPRLRRQGP